MSMFEKKILKSHYMTLSGLRLRSYSMIECESDLMNDSECYTYINVLHAVSTNKSNKTNSNILKCLLIKKA